VQKLTESVPLVWLLRPFRWMTRPYLASDVGEFFRALWTVLGLVGLHYLWVIRSNVAFEEGSLELARRRAEASTAVRQGRLPVVPKKRKRPPFALKPLGPTPIALLWKNLISAGQFFTVRLALVVLVIAITISISVRASAGYPEAAMAIGIFSGTVSIWVVLLGP